ncbi:MAG: alpha/beta hydrolase [Actinomycetota bacterium]|nr:alpha/beta hydrolase [Actinomycetota bacterium]
MSGRQRMTTTAPTKAGIWTSDFLGPDYQCLRLELGVDEEGPVVATLVRHFRAPPAAADPVPHWWQRLPSNVPAPPHPGGSHGPADWPSSNTPAPAVLYLHGWADYFFQAEMAEFFTSRGFAFYALDLHKYGRSLFPGQSEGFTTDLEVYDADIEAALAAIRADLGQRRPQRIHLMAHSLGGLIGALWADRHPGRLASLMLNGPWLELQGSRFVRQIATHLVDPFAKSDPKRIFRFPEMSAYWQSVSSTAHGDWTLDPRWRPEASFPLRAGWIRAVLNGHAQVGRGLTIDAPVLMLLSRRTIIQSDWSPEMMEVDAVIDVDEMARLGLKIGRRVMVNRYPGALHDVMLSAPPVRQLIYADLSDWMRAYGSVPPNP